MRYLGFRKSKDIKESTMEHNDTMQHTISKPIPPIDQVTGLIGNGYEHINEVCSDLTELSVSSNTNNSPIVVESKTDVIHIDPVQIERLRLSKYSLNCGYTDNYGCYIPVKNELINDRYLDLANCIGVGAFSNVIEAYDNTTKNHVAIKMGKYGDKIYSDAITKEYNFMKYLNEKNCYGIMVILDHFIFHNHNCIVMPIMKMSLYRALNTKIMNVQNMKYISYQLVLIVKGLIEYGIIHCDIKPHNILIDDFFNIKLIDFGLAVTIGQRVSHYIQTRWYRSPEVILNLQTDYNYATMDIWSCACIIFEIFTKTVLFRGRASYDETRGHSYNQLLTIIGTLGDIPQSILIFCNTVPDNHVMNYYNCSQNKGFYINGKDFVKYPSIEDRINATHYDITLKKQLVDLLLGMLNYNTIDRLKPKDILETNFFKNIHSIFNI